MKLVALTAVAVPALLCSTAVMAQDVSAGFSLGASVLKLPTGQNGVLTSGDVTVTGSDPLIIAPTIGFSSAVSTGPVGEDWEGLLGVNLFATFGVSDSSLTQSFSGVGTVYIPGVSLPDDGSITLTTSRGSTASANFAVTSTPPSGGPYNSSDALTSGPADGADTTATVSSNSSDSFVVGGGNTAVSGGEGSALSYGGIADESGSLLIITGDLDGLSISTETSTKVLYSGGDITWGVTTAPKDGVVVQAYAGPSYRYLGQWSTTTTGASMVVDIPEVDGSTTIHPFWEQTVDTTLNSHYFGGLAGGGVSIPVSDGVSLGFGAEASLYYATSSLQGTGSVRTYGGYDEATDTSSPDVTVTQDPTDAFSSGLAYAVRGQASASFAVAESTALTFAGTLEYLSRVARPYSGATVTTDSDGASWISGSSNGDISFGDMFNFTATASLTKAF